MMTALVDCDIGPSCIFMISLGFRDVHLEVEVDKIFTVVGRIDAERRWNWAMIQRRAARHDLAFYNGIQTGGRGENWTNPRFNDDQKEKRATLHGSSFCQFTTSLRHYTRASSDTPKLNAF